MAHPDIGLAHADSMGELQAENARQPRAVVLTFLVANVLLTSLQFFWGSKIAKAVADMLGGSKKDA